MKKTLLMLSALSLALMMTGCKAKNGMTSATSQPTSTASPSASPNVTNVIPGVM